MIILEKKKNSISVQEFRMHIVYIQRKAIPTWEARENCASVMNE